MNHDVFSGSIISSHEMPMPEMKKNDKYTVCRSCQCVPFFSSRIDSCNDKYALRQDACKVYSCARLGNLRLLNLSRSSDFGGGSGDLTSREVHYVSNWMNGTMRLDERKATVQERSANYQHSTLAPACSV
ncbi:hypothetical protein MTO96_018629 [Rhipicephalus appendiculatus]